MGYAIAEVLASHGAKVSLLSGPTHLQVKNPLIQRFNVVEAMEMYQKAMEIFPHTDGAIMAAAVADFTPVDKADQKVKRGKDNWTIELKPNPDIAASLGKIKKPHQILVGFALETNDEEKNASLKLKKKNLDFIILNSLQEKGAGFGVDTNKITILDANGQKTPYSLKSKKEVAEDIVNYLIHSISAKSNAEK